MSTFSRDERWSLKSFPKNFGNVGGIAGDSIENFKNGIWGTLGGLVFILFAPFLTYFLGNKTPDIKRL